MITRNVTMSAKRMFELLEDPDLLEDYGLDYTDFSVDCPYCNEKDLENSGIGYWYCYNCKKKIFKEDLLNDTITTKEGGERCPQGEFKGLPSPIQAKEKTCQRQQ